jgi:hypothetical protein
MCSGEHAPLVQRFPAQILHWDKGAETLILARRAKILMWQALYEI